MFPLHVGYALPDSIDALHLLKFNNLIFHSFIGSPASVSVCFGQNAITPSKKPPGSGIQTHFGKLQVTKTPLEDDVVDFSAAREFWRA